MAASTDCDADWNSGGGADRTRVGRVERPLRFWLVELRTSGSPDLPGRRFRHRLPALIATHELIHALGYPKFGFTRSTVIAVWPSRLLFYAGSFDAIRRNRMLLVYVLPLL